ncbi:MAG: PilW family protein [Gammaproteobacteria bacterium]
MRTSKTKPQTATPLQKGFTLIELMISIVIGLFILSAVLSLFVSMIKSDADNAKAVQLNQELRTVMSLMTRDIRRAGANRNAASDSLEMPPSNPFSVAGSTLLSIAANAQGDADSCITYSYDANDGTNELYGFRLDSGEHTVETRASGQACNEGGWNDLTDNNLVNITELTFADNPVMEGGITIHEINIELYGQLVSDSSVFRTISETVRVRNDEF